jgi:hypothetical protein
MRANRSAKGLLGNDEADAGAMLAGTIGVVVLIFAVTVLVGPIADEVNTADTNANVSQSAIAILDLSPVFLGLLVLGAIAAVVLIAFR